MRGGSPKPIARPMRKTSAFFAPTTCAMRPAVTNGQLRQMNTWRRLGKCGNETGLGAEPLGRSAKAKADGLTPTSPNVDHTVAPSANPAAAVELVLRNVRREYWFVGFSIIIRWRGKSTEQPLADKH